MECKVGSYSANPVFEIHWDGQEVCMLFKSWPFRAFTTFRASNIRKGYPIEEQRCNSLSVILYPSVEAARKALEAEYEMPVPVEPFQYLEELIAEKKVV